MPETPDEPAERNSCQIIYGEGVEDQARELEALAKELLGKAPDMVRAEDTNPPETDDD